MLYSRVRFDGWLLVGVLHYSFHQQRCLRFLFYFAGLHRERCAYCLCCYGVKNVVRAGEINPGTLPAGYVEGRGL